MKNKITALVLTILFVFPCVLRAVEVEVQLFEVIPMGTIPGDDPLDDPIQYPGEPPRPNDFHASINGNLLTINRQNSSIPSAQATVVNASTGNIVVNQQFTSSLSEQISISGVYVLHIQTSNGALTGQFIIQ